MKCRITLFGGDYIITRLTHGEFYHLETIYFNADGTILAEFRYTYKKKSDAFIKYDELKTKYLQNMKWLTMGEVKEYE